MNKKKTIGILNKGKDNKFENNEFIGLDVGIDDRGERTTAKSNKFVESGQKKIAEPWHLKWWMKYLIYPLIVLVIGTFLIHLI